MTFALVLSAVRRHPFSVGATAFITFLGASLLSISAPLALVAWTLASLLVVELWYVLEPLVLERSRHLRPPTFEETQRLDAALGRAHLRLLVSKTSDLIAVRGLRCMVVGRDYFDLFEDRALGGLLTQAAAGLHAANLVGYLMVWVGTLPLRAVWQLSGWLHQLGRLLAVAVGASLVLPLVLWPNGFLRWTGRLFGAGIVGLLGAVLLSSGLAAAGLGLLVAWVAIPALAALLAWESRRVELAADLATIDVGFGPQLLEALQFLMVAEPRPQLTGLLGLLGRPGSRLVDRAAFIRGALSSK